MDFERKKYSFENKEPCVIIAEVGVNHNGDPEIAQKMVDVAVKARANIVKFQLFKSEKEISKYAPKAPYQSMTTSPDENQLEMCKSLELDITSIQRMKRYCSKKGIGFLCTAFESDSADKLANILKLKTVKIPSGEITNLPFLEYIGLLFDSVVLSTGASTIAETQSAIQAINKGGCTDILLLHCVTSYPADVGDVNLRVMKTMEDALGYRVGFSDHTQGITVAMGAVALGAAAIEKHFTLDRSLPGPDHRASIEPDELCAMVKGIREIESALGSPIKKPQPCELPNLHLVRKGLVASRDLKKGETLREEMIEIKRPEMGISPGDFHRILGMKLTREVKDDAPIRWEDLK